MAIIQHVSRSLIMQREEYILLDMASATPFRIWRYGKTFRPMREYIEKWNE